MRAATRSNFCFRENESLLRKYKVLHGNSIDTFGPPDPKGQGICTLIKKKKASVSQCFPSCSLCCVVASSQVYSQT